MSFNKVGFEESLKKNVVDAGLCVGCGACVVACPFNCLEYVDAKPKLAKECKVCGICAQVCPQNEWSQPKAETFVFGRRRKPDEVFGVYRKLAVARAKNNEVLKVCQDGGVVTALLLFALENGIIDCAVVSGTNRDKPLCPIPKLATTSKEILESAGTRYSYSPNILALTEAIKQKRAKISFVGTPCQIRAIRKMQMAGLKKYTAPLKILVGLMCSECFIYEGLVHELIHQKLGVNPNNVAKVNIKGKLFITTKSDVKSISLAEAKQYARESCKSCEDFSSELADISVGGLGLDGWSFVVIRTENGETLFEMAEKTGVLETQPVERNASALNLLVKLSTKKRSSTSKGVISNG
ncbi:MAG: Coenzyme F420 hydrogenase/dehydrogenase, beta subunit C-terminal domain [Candidatus Bathyarchaeia archaeon]